jgi:hypothetical protein
MSYSVTPTLSVEAAQDRLTLLLVFEGEVRFVGVLGAVVSLMVPVLVVTLSDELAAETLPAASFALTVKLYAVFADNPLTVTEVLVELPAKLPPL